MAEYVKREDVLALETDLRFDNLGIEYLNDVRIHHIDPIKVELLPAADVREKFRGKWIPVNEYEFVCSECRSFWIERNFKTMYNFCPHCGADMRGDENDAC